MGLASRGRLTKVSNAYSSTEYNEYDPLGRILQSRQITDWNAFPFSYSYDLAGNVTQQIYPAGRVLAYSQDIAGRLTGINGFKTGEANVAYVSQASYAAHGGLREMAFGNGLWEQRQPSFLGMGTA